MTENASFDKAPFIMKIILTVLTLALCVMSSGVRAQFHPNILAVNPANLIGVATAQDVSDLRSELSALVRAEPGDLQFRSIYSHSQNGTYASAANLAEISIWRVPQGIGTYAPIWRFKPTSYRPGGKCALILYGGHHGAGHHASHPPYQSLLLKTIEAGCEVTAVDMPFNGLSPMALLLPVRGGGVYLTTAHEEFAYIDRPLAPFFEATLSVLDTLESEGVNNIAMAGLSGGGWATVVMAALDERIDMAYSISGSMPAYMRSWVLGSTGDWEQPFISASGFEYLDLYVAGASSGRKFRNVHLINDPCCFAGTNASHYTNAVKAAVATSGGGDYTLFLDTTATSHTVPDTVRDFIVQEIVTYF